MEYEYDGETVYHVARSVGPGSITTSALAINRPVAISRICFLSIAGALTGFVGRAHELGLLLERWKLAEDGEGRVVLLSGEPGIGKSRVLSELRAGLSSERCLREFWPIAAVKRQQQPDQTTNFYTGYELLLTETLHRTRQHIFLILI